jgi:hypothetical protein
VRLGVTYVITCGPRPSNDLTGVRLDASLSAKLQAGETPAWLERVSELGVSSFTAYRVVTR